MPVSTTCMYGEEEIAVAIALKIKSTSKENSADNPLFTCILCGEGVRPHRRGGQTEAHFEHFQRNNACTLSHGDSYSPGMERNSEFIDPDTQKAIEGYSLERKIFTQQRNAAIVLECKKRDEFKCASCGFQLRVNGKNIIDCHHLKPIGSDGERETSIDDLVCLCPNCHRIAHTSSPPLRVDEIQKITNEFQQSIQ